MGKEDIVERTEILIISQVVLQLAFQLLLHFCYAACLGVKLKLHTGLCIQVFSSVVVSTLKFET